MQITLFPFFISDPAYSKISILKVLVWMSRNISRSAPAEQDDPGMHGEFGNNATGKDVAAEWFIHIGEGIIIPTILAIAAITNLISFFVLQSSRITRTFRICLMALAISDFFATSFGFSSAVAEVVVFHGDMPHGYWDSRAVAILVLYYIQIMFMCVSASFVIFIVATRHWIVKHPLRSRDLTTLKTRRMLLGLFVITLVLYLPCTLNILWQSCHKEEVATQCQKIKEDVPNLEKIAQYYLYSLSTLYGPVLIIVYIVCLIGIRATLQKSEEVIRNLTETQTLIRNSSDNHPTSGMGSSGARQRATSKITRTLIMIVILDTICTLPTVAQGFAQLFSPQSTVFSTNTAFRVFDVVAEIFLAMRPAYNFWLYVYSHDEFRAALRGKICCVGIRNCLDNLGCFGDFGEKDLTKGFQVSTSGSGSDNMRKSVTTNTTKV